MTTNKQLENTLSKYAEFFYEPEQVWDEERSEHIEINALSFIQKGVLNDMCYSLNRQIEWQIPRVDKQRREVMAKSRQHDGTELAELALAKANHWMKRYNLQIAALETALGIAKATYEAATGEPWKTKKSAPIKVDPAHMTEAQKEAAALGIITAEAGYSGGVEAAHEENVG